MAVVAAQPLPAFGQSNETKDYQPMSKDPYSHDGQRELPGDQPDTGSQYIYQTPYEVP
jgi:hypothetical protein